MSSHGVIRARLLGTPAIDGPGVDGRVVLRQPKRLLLLAYLAARNDFVTRDTLVGLFWPLSEEDRARRALSQAIHFLRGQLGHRAIATRGSAEVALGDTIDCDVAEFDRRIRDEAWEAALSLYGGAFLDGVISPRANDLNQWLEAERHRLQRLAVTAANALADAAYRRGDLTAAIAWQEKALGINPFDETAHRGYLALLDEAGDGAGALAAHEAFRTRLRAQFDLEPSAETARIVSLIRSRRPDLASETSEAAGTALAVAGAPEPVPVTGVGRPTPEHRWRPSLPPWLRSRRKLQIGIAAVALPLVIWVGAGLNRRTPPPGPSPFMANRVAVLYFDVNGDEDVRYIADGLTEALISYLDQARALEVVPPNAVEQFRGEYVAPDSINARLKAATVISGRVAREGTLTRVTVRIENAARSVLDTTFSAESDVDDLFGIIDDVTGQVGEALGPVLAGVVANGRWRAGTENAGALAALMQGATAAKMFNDRFRAEDRSLATAAFARADSLFRAAARLDPAWIAPLVERSKLALDMAFVYELRRDLDEANLWLERAVDRARAALQLRPDAAALELEGEALYQEFALDPMGDLAILAKADSLLSAALLIDPDRAGAWATRSAVAYTKGDFGAAEEFAEKALELDAFLEDRNLIQNRVFLSAFHAGHDKAAKDMCTEMARTQRGHWTAAQCVLNLMAWSRTESPDPRRAWQELETNLMRDPAPLAMVQRPQLELMLAAVLARAGLPDSAEHVIARARQAGQGIPDMLYFEAAARMALNQPDAASDLLGRYLEGNPPNRAHVAAYRWFHTLQMPLAELNTTVRRR